MKAALADGGVLEGGDWAEGWQYGPLAVAEYALAARVAAAHGIEVAGVDRWLEALLRRTVYALEPDDRTFALGDTEDEQPSLAPSALPLDAVALGDAPAPSRAQALGERRRLGLRADDFPLYDALAEGAGVTPTDVPRASWPTSYLAVAAGALYARTSWRSRRRVDRGGAAIGPTTSITPTTTPATW